MALNDVKGGRWQIKMLTGIKRWGLKPGDIVDIPSKLRDQHALRLIESGQAERHEVEPKKATASNKMAKKAKTTKVVSRA